MFFTLPRDVSISASIALKVPFWRRRASGCLAAGGFSQKKKEASQPQGLDTESFFKSFSILCPYHKIWTWHCLSVAFGPLRITPLIAFQEKKTITSSKTTCSAWRPKPPTKLESRSKSQIPKPPTVHSVCTFC